MIGFIGGTGPEGRGLALRFAAAGEQVLIGSRDESRARDAAASVLALAPDSSVAAGANADVARRADIVFVTVPYVAHRQVLQSVGDTLTGKVVVDVVAPVAVSDGVARTVPVADGSAAQEAQAFLPNSSVAAAFQTVSARDLLVPDRPVESDVVVCAGDPEVRRTVMTLAEMIPGIRAVDGGGLHNAVYLEGMAALLININGHYRSRSSIKIVGI